MTTDSTNSTDSMDLYSHPYPYPGEEKPELVNFMQVLNECIHEIDIIIVGEIIVSYCTKCGSIRDTRSADIIPMVPDMQNIKDFIYTPGEPILAPSIAPIYSPLHEISCDDTQEELLDNVTTWNNKSIKLEYISEEDINIFFNHQEGWEEIRDKMFPKDRIITENLDDILNRIYNNFKQKGENK